MSNIINNVSSGNVSRNKLASSATMKERTGYTTSTLNTSEQLRTTQVITSEMHQFSNELMDVRPQNTII